jgi:hypothetical protein
MLGGMVLAGLTACSGSDEEPSKTDDGVKVRRITITETEGAASARQVMTRASLAEGDGILTALWTAGDRLTCCNLSRVDHSNSGAPYSGSLTAVSTATTSQFTGDVYCLAGDYLAVVYPATTFETNDSYTISLTGQNGTLSKLATNYHYVFGKATVTEVTETTANATIGKMKSLLTVCKFSFKDKNTGDAIPIKSLSISYSTGDSNNGKYPQSATVAIGVNTAQNDVHATGADITAPLTITASGQTEVYVALLPTAAQSTFNFTVSDGNGNTYSGTANATLVEGEYVDATGLKLTKQ